jgi:hypothetical protein
MRALLLLAVLSLASCSSTRAIPAHVPHWAGGCYAVSAGPWSPLEGFPRTQLPPRVELPQVLHLEPERREPAGPVGFRVRTAPAFSVQEEAYWHCLPNDSIRVVWDGSTALHGYEMLVARQGEGLIGIFGPFSDIPSRDEFRRPVQLQRIRCLSQPLLIRSAEARLGLVSE